MSAGLAIVLASICLAGGGLLGFLLGRGGGKEKQRAEALEQEFEDYKRNVTEHFGKTAEHFQSIGRQYRELYEHMAGGASTLCEEDDRTRLAFPSLLTIEAVAETTPASEPALDAAPAAQTEDAAAPVEAQAADIESEAPAEEAEPAAAAESEPESEAPAPAEAAADAEAEAEVDATPETAAADDDALAAGDGADDELKVEVSVEVIDDDETGTEGAVLGATPLADTKDLDPTDDAKATRH